MLKSWRDFEHCKVPVVRARVEEIVRRVSGPNVLEVGCNEGFLAKAIAEERGFDVVAVDNRVEALKSAKELFGLTTHIADAGRLPFEDDSFDCVVLGEILEHLWNPGLGLSEAFRVSKGHVILSLPIGKYWNGEPTHIFQVNGCAIGHDETVVMRFLKNVFVVEFRKIRSMGPDGRLSWAVSGGFEDR